MDFCLLAKNMCENIGGSISKNLSSKCSQKLLDHAKQFGTDAYKTASKRTIQETAEGTGGFIVNKIANTILNKIIQRQFQMSTIKKYLKEVIDLQKKDTKLLINWD